MPCLLTQELKTWALEAGFDRVGTTRLAPSPTAGKLEEWLERGDQAGMSYLANRTEARADPRLLFDGAASAVCVALQYHGQNSELMDGDLWPGVARYARGRDYHNVMTKRLRKLARRIEAAYPGTLTKPYVDTGPVLERELAAAAGLGAVGKNTLLLHPEAGSYFFLGELITSLELEAEPAVADLCGSCSLCLEACPTGAFPEAYRLDANRCISYWTIEHRGSIPEAMRPELGEWVFGCDVCQEVCPVNDRPRADVDPAFQPAAIRRDLSLVDLLEMGEEDYQEWFVGSPMKRSRLSGLRRNAAIAMGNRGDQRYVEPLCGALEGEDPVVRSHAAWALGRIGGIEAAGRLRTALLSEADVGVVEAVDKALEGLEP